MTRDADRPVTELHPWNRGFTWRVPDGPYRLLSGEQAAAFDRDGFVVLDDVVDLDVLAAVEKEVDEFDAGSEEVLRGMDNERLAIAEAGAITFTTHLVTRSERIARFSRLGPFLALCADLVGPDVNLYWDQAVYKKTEKPRPFPWHQDNGYAFVEPQQYLTCWVPLTDATLDNGCPWVAPGFHHHGTLVHRYVDPLGFQCFNDPPGAVPAPVRRGGIVVFSSLTPHLTGPNVTAAARKAYILQYAPAGAVVLHGDPTRDEQPVRVAADAPDRQYPVLRDGRPVVDPATP